MLEGLLSHAEHDCQPPVNGVDNAHGHLRGGVPVVGAHGAALLLAAAGGLVTHQLIDHPRRDAGVLQPGRVGVAEVVGAVQVDRIQEGVALDRQRRGAAGGLVLVDVDRGQAGGLELPQGDRDRGRLGRAAGGGQYGGFSMSLAHSLCAEDSPYLAV
jgi:hypothetical protein